nr:acyloxyacyl hydrolase [Shewanella sairae]
MSISMLFIASLFFFSGACTASASLELAYGFIPTKESGSTNGNSWRVSYSHKINHFDNFLNDYNLNLRLEFSTQKGHANNASNNYVLSINPIFQYLWQSEPVSLFVEFGIGAAYFENSYYLDRNLGANWLFEDKLGVGVIINRHHRLGVFFMHYSNADLASHNDGADSIGINYGYIW